MKRFFSAGLLWYLRTLAKLQLRKINPQIVGITGSAGKTSTMHAVVAVLQDQFQIKASYKANSETGIPLNILDLHLETFTVVEWLKVVVMAPIQMLINWKKYDIYVVEMGIDSPHPPKNMEYLLKIIRPHISVFLNARPMHSQGFDELVDEQNYAKRKELITKEIAKEKGKLITQLKTGGTAVLNADDENVFAFAKHTKAAATSFGFGANAEVRVTDVAQSLDGTTVTLTYQNQTATISLPQYLLPHHFGATLAASAAVGVQFGLSLEHIKKGLEKNLLLPPGRATLLEGINGSYIFDSSYNASAQPVIDCLDLLEKLHVRRRLALLGDMRELGEVAQIEHELVARKAAAVCDVVVLVGPQMKQFALPVLKKTFQNTAKRAYFCENAYLAADLLNPMLAKDDLLVVKGSQNTLLLEIAVEGLMARPEEAGKLLCRRGEFWERKREKIRGG